MTTGYPPAPPRTHLAHRARATTPARRAQGQHPALGAPSGREHGSLVAAAPFDQQHRRVVAERALLVVEQGTDEPPHGLRDRQARGEVGGEDRKSTRLNSSHMSISYAVFCLKKKKKLK